MVSATVTFLLNFLAPVRPVARFWVEINSHRLGTALGAGASRLQQSGHWTVEASGAWGRLLRRRFRRKCLYRKGRLQHLCRYIECPKGRATEQ